MGTGSIRIGSKSHATPLGVVIAFVFLNSVGGGVITTGFAFLAQNYGFTAANNYWLGLAQGAAYIAGALGVGPLMRRLARVGTGPRRATPRHVLLLLLTSLAAVCLLPWLVRRMELSPGAAESAAINAPATWPFWVMVIAYSVLTGVLWPITESYLSGGRSGAALRSATGLFNVAWSSALVVAYWCMGPLLKDHTVEVIAAVGLLHFACIAMLPLFAARPAAHGDAAEALRTPESVAQYRRLLGVFRVQLPTSYFVYSALNPYLPKACEDLGIDRSWAAPLAAIWLISRALTFAGLQRWHGWHGRWVTAWAGSLILLAGFGAAVLATTISHALGRHFGIAALVAGLGAFGVGMGVIYTSALYYALAVGNAEVDAGGKHEALIGLGYGAGPVCGLLAIAASQAGYLAPGSALGGLTGGRFEVGMLILVSVLCVGLVAWSLLRTRGTRSPLPAPGNPFAADR